MTDGTVPGGGDYNRIPDLGVSGGDTPEELLVNSSVEPSEISDAVDVPNEVEIPAEDSGDPETIERTLPDPEVIKAMLADPLYSRRLRRPLTRAEVVKMDKVQRLHNLLHLGSDSLKRLVSGGALGKSDLTAADVDNYHELVPQCLACLANMRTPPNQPFPVPSGRLPGTWWEMDAMLIRGVWYSIFVDGVTSQLWSIDNFSMTMAGQRFAALRYVAFLKRTFPNNDREPITFVVDWQSCFGEYVKVHRHITILHSAVEGHANRGEASIKKIGYGYRTLKSPLPYPMPLCLDKHAVKFLCKMRGFFPSSSRDAHTAYSTVYGVRMNLEDAVRIQFGAMGRALIPLAMRKGNKSSTERSRDCVIVGFERGNPSNLILFAPDTEELISRGLGFTLTPENPKLVADMTALALKQSLKLPAAADNDFRPPVPATVEDIAAVVPDPIANNEDAPPLGIAASAIAGEIQKSPRATPTFDTSKMTVRQAGTLFSAAVVAASLAVEFANMEKNSVLRPVARALRDSTVVRGHVVMKIKYLDGAEDKLKARLVADGNGQDPAECGNTKAPTIDRAAWHLLMAHCKKIKGKIWSVDIPSAFLHAPLNGDNVNPPPGPIFMVLGASTAALLCEAQPHYRSFLQKNGTLIFEIMTSLYGLRQSPRNWFLYLGKILASAGLTQAVSERCEFSWWDGDKVVHIVFWVDDLFLLGNDEVRMAKIIRVLEDRFGKLDVKKDAFNFLGMYISLQPDHSITVDNTAYVLSILANRWTEEIGVEFSRRRGVLTPSTEDLFTSCDDSYVASPAEILEFQGQIGELMHATYIRVDILKEVTFLSTRNHCPCDQARKAYRQVIAYLHLNPSRPVNFGSTDSTLYVYPDAAYGVHPDGFSHTGIFVTLGLNGGPILVKSKKQKMICRSSSEAELIAAADAVDRAKFLCKLMVEMRMIKSIHFVLMEDNTSTIFMMKNGEGVGGRAKHFLIRYQDITDLVSKGMITLRHCPTKEMIADYLTKGMIGPDVVRQIIRAMYHEDAEELNRQGALALSRIEANQKPK